jgi:hypothetical protein
VLVYPAGADLSATALRFLARELAARRREQGTRWRRLTAGRQALTLCAGRQAVNRSHAKSRALVEQAVATFKSWRLLRKLRCSTTHITNLVQAVLTLHLACSN